MRITLIQHGKTRDAFIQEGVALFRKRVERYVPYKEETLPDLKNSRNMGMQEVKEKEADQLLKRIKGADYLVLLDEQGKEFDSIAFARHLNQLEGRVSNLVFVIGGPYGFCDRVYARANEKIALSRLTFSHQLVRVLFMEQLYRAFTILKGEPYHHS
ncbi:MAG: 23S rRNA (pseudouridine(1915)-N(3))-methyltransferase RlmH [Bacteroidetes bacterium]|nr:MAG: 23S rRNA (pseudouridine(1915)-N(3))-methyltransferase RlmH [Bacteroidota bacterium]